MSKNIDYENKLKKCNQCGQVKSFNSFYKSGMALKHICKECTKKNRKNSIEKMIEDYDNEDYDYFKQWDLEQTRKEINKYKTLKDLQDKIDEAIKYINKTEYLPEGYKKNLLAILEGEDK